MTHQQAVDTLASERYLLDEMSELERHAFEDHFFSCVECAEDIRAGASLRDAARRTLGGARRMAADSRSAEVRAFAPRPRRFPLSTIMPWAAAAMLAVAVGYESLIAVPRLRHEVAPQALTPVTLHASTRGEEPAIPLAADGATTLALDVNPIASGAQLTYDLRTVDGGVVVSGRAPAPVAGAPLLLMLPAGTLKARSRYVLSIRAASDNRLVGEYRFSAAGP